MGFIHESEVSLRSAKQFWQYGSSLFRRLHSPSRPAVQMDLVNISLLIRVARNQTSIYSSKQGGDIALFGKLFFNWLVFNILATSIIT